jgi:hypothetical protein
MIVWGGWDGTIATNTGAIYNPTSDTWMPMTTTNAPTARVGAAYVWDPYSKRLFVWGGKAPGTGTLNDGAWYDPFNDTWTPINLPGAPRIRDQATAATDGSGLILIVGGNDGAASPLNNLYGSFFDQSMNRWMPFSMPNSGNLNPVAGWDGTTFVVSGGDSSGATLKISP